MKFGTQSNSNMKNSMVMFNRSIFERKYPFYDKTVSKLFVKAAIWNIEL